MIPTADHGVGVRFSRGNALMVSNGPSGAIMLLPVRYNDTQKFYFSIAAFNTSGYPINIGSEDVRLYLDGQPYRVQDFDYLRHSARTTAQREMNLAWADAAVEYFLTVQEMEDHPRRHDIAYRSASGQLQASHDHIQRRLRQTISTLGRTMLETTTIDPGTAHGGAILAEQMEVHGSLAAPLALGQARNAKNPTAGSHGVSADQSLTSGCDAGAGFGRYLTLNFLT